jgi:hypothetical protein
MCERIEKNESKQLRTKTVTEIAMNSSISVLLERLNTFNEVSIKNENPIKLVEAFKIWTALLELLFMVILLLHLFFMKK